MVVPLLTRLLEYIIPMVHKLQFGSGISNSVVLSNACHLSALVTAILYLGAAYLMYYTIGGPLSRRTKHVCLCPLLLSNKVMIR
jgi:hypothetical protein